MREDMTALMAGDDHKTGVRVAWSPGNHETEDTTGFGVLYIRWQSSMHLCTRNKAIYKLKDGFRFSVDVCIRRETLMARETWIWKVTPDTCTVILVTVYRPVIMFTMGISPGIAW